MARKRNPKRDEAYQIYADSGGNIKLADIAGKLDVPDVRVRKWKSVDKWDEKIMERSNSINWNVPFRDDKGKFTEGNTAAVGHGAPIGNQNSVGHRSSVPPCNTNAVATGEYQTIWLDQLSPEEQALLDKINTDPLAQIDEDIKLLTHRERLMLGYLNELKAQKELIETRDVYAIKDKPQIISIYDETINGFRTEKTTKSDKVLIEQTKTAKLLIDKILRVEEALTRVQEKKIRAVETKHKMTIDKDLDSAGEINISIERKKERG